MAAEEKILEALRLAYESQKIALPPLDWIADRQHAAVLRCPIVCECADPRAFGVEIRGTAFAHRPNEHVGFQLLMDIGGQDYRIARVDWRPRSPHTNKFGGPAIRGSTVMTSVHDYPENAELGLALMQDKNLPIARAIDPEPADFNALLHYLRDKLALTNALEIPVPPWSRTLPL